MSTLRTLIDHLRPQVMSAALAPRGLNVPVREVVVYDQVDEGDLSEGDLVLGVGLGADERTRSLMAYFGAAGACAIALKLELPIDAALSDAAEHAGVAILAVPHAAAWAQLVVLIRTELAQGAFEASTDGTANLSGDDLFGMADALATLVDGPVTIEDPSSRVIAYSGRQEEADAPRIETILGRRVSERIIRRLRREGIFERLARSIEPIYLEAGIADMPRVAVALRAGGEIVGSVWAAVKAPPDPDRLRVFTEATKLVAFHVTRHRLQAGIDRRARAQLVWSMLDGHADAARDLHFEGESFRVLAAEVEGQGDVDPEFLRMRLWDIVEFDLSAALPAVRSVLANGIVYAVAVTVGSDQAERAKVMDAVGVVAARAAAALHTDPRIGIGRRVAGISDIPRSRADAEEVIGILRAEPSRRVAEVADVRLQLLMQRLRDVLAEDKMLAGGPLQVLVEHDAAHHTDYVETLSAYLDAFGDVLAAARQLNVHSNTFRYRLSKLRQLEGLRLDDPEERLLLALQLRLLARPRAAGRSPEAVL